MKAVVNFKGDMSVGIFPYGITIDFGGSVVETILKDDWTERKQFRDTIKDCFSDLIGEKADVLFSDECPDCGVILTNKVCKNKNCIVNI